MPQAFDAASLIASLPERPGVYRMLGAGGEVLYVGKAKDLKRRVASYFRKRGLSPRIALMVAQIADVAITVTRSEAEALLLENNLIKELAPRYNILFRDDKSYPYLRFSAGDFPQIACFRGSPRAGDRLFGPFPSAAAVRESTHLLQKMFCLRTCEDNVFSNRSRPCLLHQIHRCSGPCVGLISREAYAQDLRMATCFLEGRDHEIFEHLRRQMEAAAERLAFEEAAALRDRLRALQRVRETQIVEDVGGGDGDIVVVLVGEAGICVNLAMVRGGRHLGDRPHFPTHAAEYTPAEVLEAFVEQHYAGHPLPARLFTNLSLSDDSKAFLQGLSEKRLAISVPRKNLPRAWVERAEANAAIALTARQQSDGVRQRRLQALCDALQLDETPQRIECFDISHTQGEATVASCVVWAEGDMRRPDYRRYNIQGITPGDDYAAMRQALHRRFEKVASGEGVAPSLLLVDGGAGQLSCAVETLSELGLGDQPMIGVAKGEGRKAGLEQLVFPDGRPPLKLASDHPGLMLVLEIRDEAHRFAITGHRAKRGKARQRSRLEDIPGVGADRRRRLLAHFDGLRGIMAASVEDVARVPGIGRRLAETILRHLQD